MKWMSEGVYIEILDARWSLANYLAYVFGDGVVRLHKKLQIPREERKKEW